MVSQHPRNVYPGIFLFGAIHENFVPRKFPAIQYFYQLLYSLTSIFVHNL